MSIDLYYPVDTEMDINECHQAIKRLNKDGQPIVFKVKGTNYYVALVQQIKSDIIRVGSNNISYSKFIDFLSKKGIEGNVNIIATKNEYAESVYDSNVKIGLTPLHISKRIRSKNKFITDQTGCIILLSKNKKKPNIDDTEICML